METITAAEVTGALTALVPVLEGAREQLCLLDGEAGDGDLGITMALGIRAVADLLPSLAGEEIGTMLMRSGMAFNQAAPSTMGTLTATALIRAGKAVQGRRELTPADVRHMAQAAVQGIQDRGKANLGDKTILDALVPAAEALESALESGKSLREAGAAAAAAARAGAEATAGMTARAGRASWVGERARHVPDGGAVLCRIVLEALAS